jgi:malate dehydrogenase (quinone)
MLNSHYLNVVVIGGGISGSALLYTLSKYTDISDIALFEKYDKIASVNSSVTGNSQTLHCGDIETNYTLEKAKKVKKTASMLENYCLNHNYDGKYMHKFAKMALGVGDKEVEYIKNRYEEFKELYPYMELWDKDKLAQVEPNLVNGRKEDIMAMGTMDKYCAIDFGAVSNSFIENAEKEKHDKRDNINVFLSEEILSIKHLDDKLELKSDKGTYYADYVVVNAGAHSLLLAHNMGYGENYSCLPIGGSFFYAKKNCLNSKVYTVQNPKLPFAAVHGDPDIAKNNTIRFGPTALALPKLERFHSAHFMDFLESLSPDADVLKVFYDLMHDSDIREFVLKNFMYEIPGVRRKLFVKELQKIVPTLGADDIEYAQNVGGLRPQVIDKVNRKLMLGEAKIDTKKGLVFNMTPSPGATSCIGNAIDDTKMICKFLGKTFYKDKFKSELLKSTD